MKVKLMRKYNDIADLDRLVSESIANGLVLTAHRKTHEPFVTPFGIVGLVKDPVFCDDCVELTVVEPDPELTINPEDSTTVLYEDVEKILVVAGLLVEDRPPKIKHIVLRNTPRF